MPRIPVLCDLGRARPIRRNQSADCERKATVDVRTELSTLKRESCGGARHT